MKILIPYDGSDYCIKAFEYVIDNIYVLNNCEIHILHVQKNYLPSTGETSYIRIDSYPYKSKQIHDQKHGKITLDTIHKAVKFFKTRNIEINLIVGFGHPADVILEVSRVEYFDLIVMCSMSLEPSSHLAIGSTTNKVVHCCPVPILIIE